MEQESFSAPELSAEELLPDEQAANPTAIEDAKLKAILEAIIYVTDEPLSLDQIATAIEQPRERVMEMLEQLANEYERPERGLTIREVAAGFKMSTKPEHHEAVRRFVKNLNPPLKLSLPALETLAVIAYKQPITAPEIMEIRGVQGAGVLKTLIDRKLISTSGRKQVIGKPILYKTTREFLVQFGLKDLNELPSLKEFQELASSEIPALSEPVPIRDGAPAPADDNPDASPAMAQTVAESAPADIQPEAVVGSIPADAESGTSILAEPVQESAPPDPEPNPAPENDPPPAEPPIEEPEQPPAQQAAEPVAEQAE